MRDGAGAGAGATGSDFTCRNVSWKVLLGAFLSPDLVPFLLVIDVELTLGVGASPAEMAK